MNVNEEMGNLLKQMGMSVPEVNWAEKIESGNRFPKEKEKYDFFYQSLMQLVFKPMLKKNNIHIADPVRFRVHLEINDSLNSYPDWFWEMFVFRYDRLQDRIFPMNFPIKEETEKVIAGLMQEDRFFINFLNPQLRKTYQLQKAFNRIEPESFIVNWVLQHYFTERELFLKNEMEPMMDKFKQLVQKVWEHYQ